MLKYRRLIEPQLNVNEEIRHYYDIWGGRRYLYCEGVDYQPLGKSVNNRLSYLLMPMYFAMNLAASIYLVVRNFPMRQIWGLTL